MEIISKLQKGIHDGLFWIEDKIGDSIKEHLFPKVQEEVSNQVINITAAPMLIIGMKVSLVIIGFGFICIVIGKPTWARKCIAMGTLSFLGLQLF